MLQKLIYIITRRSHPWRAMKFDELAELYTSMSLRSLGFSLIGIFVPIFLYKNGISVQLVFYFYTLFFIFRIPIAYASAHVVGRVGPKHGLALSTVLFVVFLSMLLSYQTIVWPLELLALMFTITNGLFFISYHTDFSKIKNSKHAGKELGWLFIFERIGGALGPVLGGLAATFVAPELTIVLAIAVFVFSLIPLFLTNEPVRLHQHISFAGFKWREHIRDGAAMGAFGIDNVASIMFWPLLVGITVFQDGTYAKVGAVVGVGYAVSLLSAHIFGIFIDNKRGRMLMHYGVVLNAVMHTLRPFTLSQAGVVAISTANEPVTLAYRMPLSKGQYDVADTVKGYRIVYLSWLEMVTAFYKVLYTFGLYIACFYFDDILVLRMGFIAVAFISLLMLSQNFPALKKT